MQEEEHNIQVACVNWFRYQYPKYIIYATPNGGWRNAIVAAKLKAEGVLAGVADLTIVALGKVVFVEMKTAKGKQQPSQKVFEAGVKRLGHEYYVCHSFDEFRECCKAALTAK
jgi:hypothetical protein